MPLIMEANSILSSLDIFGSDIISVTVDSLIFGTKPSEIRSVMSLSRSGAIIESTALIAARTKAITNNL